MYMQDDDGGRLIWCTSQLECVRLDCLCVGLSDIWGHITVKNRKAILGELSFKKHHSPRDSFAGNLVVTVEVDTPFSEQKTYVLKLNQDSLASKQ